MKTSELIKILRKNKCFLVRHGSSHDVWESEITGNRFSVPRHSSDDVKKGLAESILEKAGIK